MADQTQSSTVIPATPAQVLDVVAAVEDYPSWSPELREVEVLAEDDGWAERVRFVIDAGPISDRYVLAYDWDVDEDGAGEVSWRLVEGGVLRALDGSYTLTSVGTDAAPSTRVTYALSVDARVPLPGPLRRRAESRIVEGALSGLAARVAQVHT